MCKIEISPDHPTTTHNTHTTHTHAQHMAHTHTPQYNIYAPVPAIFNELDSFIASTRKLAKQAQDVMKRCMADNKAYGEANPGAPSLIFRENMLNTHAKHFQVSRHVCVCVC